MGPDGPIYPGTCRRLTEDERAARIAAGTPYAIRLDSAKAAALAGPLSFSESGAGPNGEHGVIAVAPGLFGDVVLARKDMPAAYHLAVVVDDAYQGVTLVTRGNDLFAGDSCAAAVAGAARPARAGLCASPADPGCAGEKVLQGATMP